MNWSKNAKLTSSELVLVVVVFLFLCDVLLTDEFNNSYCRLDNLTVSDKLYDGVTLNYKKDTYWSMVSCFLVKVCYYRGGYVVYLSGRGSVVNLISETQEVNEHIGYGNGSSVVSLRIDANLYNLTIMLCNDIVRLRRCNEWKKRSVVTLSTLFRPRIFYVNLHVGGTAT